MDSDLPGSDRQPFIDKRLYLKKVDNLGYGVFTNGDIEENKFIEIAPVLICEKDIDLKNIFDYAVSWNDKVGLPLGWTMLYNHSDNNCCDFSSNYYENLLAVITNRKIIKGEQITVNYGHAWFASRGKEKILI